MQPRYDIFVMGFEPGREGQAAPGLVRVFGIDLETAKRLVTSVPVRVKRQVPEDLARRYETSLRGLGATIDLRPTAEHTGIPPAGQRQPTRPVGSGPMTAPAGQVSLPAPEPQAPKSAIDAAADSLFEDPPARDVAPGAGYAPPASYTGAEQAALARGMCAAHPTTRSTGSCEYCLRAVCDRCAVRVSSGLLCDECRVPMVAEREGLVRTESHVRGLGRCYLASSALMLVAWLAAVVWLGGVFPDAPTGALVVGALLGVLGALPGLLIGWGLYRLSPRVRGIALVASAFGLLGFPLWTAIHAYYLFVLGGEQGRIVLSERYETLREQTPDVLPPRSIPGILATLLASLSVVVTIAIFVMQVSAIASNANLGKGPLGRRQSHPR